MVSVEPVAKVAVPAPAVPVAQQDRTYHLRREGARALPHRDRSALGIDQDRIDARVGTELLDDGVGQRDACDFGRAVGRTSTTSAGFAASCGVSTLSATSTASHIWMSASAARRSRRSHG